MKSTVALTLLLVSGAALSCGKTDTKDFGPYYGQLGDSAAASAQEVVISTSFLTQLSKSPTGKELDKNRNELFYLLSVSNLPAVKAGLATLINLIKHPSFETECDSQHEMYGKEELAFALSRTEHLLEELCNITPADRDVVVTFYAAHSELYSNYDPPWMPGDLACK